MFLGEKCLKQNCLIYIGKSSNIISEGHSHEGTSERYDLRAV